MSKIIALSDSIIAKIAAGEVIFRPQSVVKELIENAIDAGALNIRIQIKAGGKAQISVFDDGSGMDRDDLLNCYLRHTTSKITDITDLERVTSLGFRGEALASIAAVSKLKIASRTADAELGNMVEIKGGELKMKSEIGMEKGTEIKVFNLFFNLPARRKFLRSDSWESRLIIDKTKYYAYAYPEIGFSLTIDGREVINLQTTEDKNRIEQITGIRKQNLIEITGGRSPVRIKGFLSDPSRQKQGDGLIYVNRRPIINRKVNSIIRDYYNTKQPFYLLLLDCDPSFVDVNVHPSKAEVKFHDLRYLIDLIQSVIKKKITKKTDHLEQLTIAIGETDQRPERLFQIHKSYILAEIKDGFIIIDQHAAHERIIFEQIMKKVRMGQPLLFPISVDLNQEQSAAYQDNKQFLSAFGIRTKEFGPKTIVIETIPDFTSIKAEDIIAIFDDLATVGQKKEEIARVIACHAAIKANTIMTEEEMAKLIDLLFGCENPYLCPHGRPTIIRLELDDIEHRFGRR